VINSFEKNKTMKKILALLLSTCFVQFSGAQVKEGKIIFEQKIDMHRRIPEENVQMRSMVPQFRTNKFELDFGENQSLYKKVEDEPDMTESNNNGMVIRMAAPSSTTYRNFTTSLSIEQRELAEKEYIIQDSIRSITCKL
jgi:GLPGLI family protein